ncbi:flippase [Chloroflexota bacterium]
MSTVQRIAKNTLVLYVAHIVTALLSAVLVVFIARILGAANYGVFSFAIVFTSLFGILTNLGMNELIIREVARDKDKASKYSGNTVVMRLILSVIVIALIITTINLMNYPRETVLVVSIFGFYTILTSLAAIFRVTFRAFERMEYEALVSVIAKLISFSLGMAVLFAGYGVVQLAFVFLFAGVAELLISFLICVAKFARPRLEADWGFWKQSLRISFPFILSNAFTLIYIRIDTVMLSKMKGDAVVGWYNAAYNLVLALEPVVFLFMTAVFPVMAQLFISSKESLKMSYEKSFKYLLILGLPMSVGLVALADRIILFLYAEGFTPSITALQIVGWYLLLVCMSRPILYLLVSINRQGWMAFIAGMGAFANIGLNLLLIPPLSYVGAAIATIATQSLVIVISWLVAARYLFKLPVHRIILKPLIASVLMGGIVYQLNQVAEVNLFLLITLGAVLYFVLIWLMKTFSAEDKELLRQVIKIRRRSP